MEKTLANVYQRADSYKFLSECYYLPDEELIEKIVDVVQTDRFFAELEDHIPPAVELDSLKIDFTRLFIGTFKLLAPPYGSFYLENNRIMGDSTIDISKLYQDERLDIAIKDVPDHIALELEFTYYLVAKQIQAINEQNPQSIQFYQQKQKSFLHSHLARWLPEFVENVQKNAQSDFYRILAKLTEEFVRKDLDACALY